MFGLLFVRGATPYKGCPCHRNNNITRFTTVNIYMYVILPVQKHNLLLLYFLFQLLNEKEKIIAMKKHLNISLSDIDDTLAKYDVSSHNTTMTTPPTPSSTSSTSNNSTGTLHVHTRCGYRYGFWFEHLYVREREN